MRILIASAAVRQSNGLWLLIGLAIPCLLSCTNTTVESVRQYQGAPLPRPDLIFVHEFAFRTDQVRMKPANESVSGASLQSQRREVGRNLSQLLAHHLVEEILVMGLAAKRVQDDSTSVGSLYSIEGQFLSIDLGDLKRREIIGVGQTEVEMKAQLSSYSSSVEIPLEKFHVTAEGTGSGTLGTIVRADSARAAKKLAVELRAFFVEQGWISP